MLTYQSRQLPYTQLTGSFTDLTKQLGARRFDLICLHNVLEYVPNPKRLLHQLTPYLAPGGRFSIVKHNRLGHVYATAIFADDPANALATYQGGPLTTQSFGALNLYTLTDLHNWLGGELATVWGVRTVYGLSQNNTVKFTADWFAHMRTLEMALATDPVAQQTAFFQHIVTAPRD